MKRRFLMLGLAFVVVNFAVGCHGRIAYLRSGCAGCSVPFSPVVRTPWLNRPFCAPAVGPVVSPAYPVSQGYPIAAPAMSSCSSCTTGSPMASAPYPAGQFQGGQVIAATGPYYPGATLPPGSVLLPSPAPTVIPPGTPKVEATTEPKPMPK